MALGSAIGVTAATLQIQNSDAEPSNSLLEAKEVYVLMQNDYKISRNIRAQWFFKNLNKTLMLKWKNYQSECSEEIEVISAVPKYNEHFPVDRESNSSLIQIVPLTKMNFLSKQYRLVFCLDLSPSIATVDLQHDSLYFAEIFSALELSLTNVCQPFYVPGSEYYFVPHIYITVIAHIPHCPTSASQVLIQGWVLNSNNVKELLKQLKHNLHEMGIRVEKANALLHEEHVNIMMSNDTGSLIDNSMETGKTGKKILDLSADISSLNLIRYGILALQLLPENSSAGIVVITDGILSFPNSMTLDSLFTQLRNSTISCSFLQVGSSFHPFSSFGRVPYKELMEFIATATCGAYFPASKDVVFNSKANEINIFHKALLFWNFQKNSTSCFLEAYEPSVNKDAIWTIENNYFYTVAHQSRVRKKHTEGTLKVNLDKLLSCRLREGYTIKNVCIDEGKNSTEVRLVLPWMLSTNIEYLITSGPGPNRQRKNACDVPNCHFEVIVDGCY